MNTIPSNVDPDDHEGVIEILPMRGDDGFFDSLPVGVVEKRATNSLHASPDHNNPKEENTSAEKYQEFCTRLKNKLIKIQTLIKENSSHIETQTLDSLNMNTILPGDYIEIKFQPSANTESKNPNESIMHNESFILSGFVREYSESKENVCVLKAVVENSGRKGKGIGYGYIALKLPITIKGEIKKKPFRGVRQIECSGRAYEARFYNESTFPTSSNELAEFCQIVRSISTEKDLARITLIRKRGKDDAEGTKKGIWEKALKILRIR